MTQEAMDKAIEVSQSTYSRLEQDTVRLRAMARQVTWDTLCQDDHSLNGRLLHQQRAPLCSSRLSVGQFHVGTHFLRQRFMMLDEF